MITTTENQALLLQFAPSDSDTKTERMMHLCDTIGSIAEHTRAVLEMHQRTAETVVPGDSDYNRNMLHLQARLETVMSRLQDTVPLLDDLALSSQLAGR